MKKPHAFRLWLVSLLLGAGCGLLASPDEGVMHVEIACSGVPCHLEVRAMDPSILTRTNMNSERLDKYFEGNDRFFSLDSEDPGLLKRVGSMLGGIAFRSTDRDASRLDLRYRLTVRTADRVVARLYMTKFGDLQYNERVFQPSGNPKWLVEVWRGMGANPAYAPVP